MKSLFVTLLFWGLLTGGCRNKKAEIVDLERKYLDSVKRYKWEVGHFVATDTSRDTKASVDKAMQLQMKAGRYQELVDSLEFELKKY